MEKENEDFSKKEFFKICQELIDEKLDNLNEELLSSQKAESKIVYKKFDKLQDKLSDEFKKDWKIFEKRWIAKVKAEVGGDYNFDDVFCDACVEESIDSWFDMEVCFENDNEQEELIAKNQKVYDAYQKKLKSKLLVIRQEIIFGDAPKLKKLFEELRTL